MQLVSKGFLTRLRGWIETVELPDPSSSAGPDGRSPGPGVRTRRDLRRVRSQRYERRGPAGVHRGRPEPDALPTSSATRTCCRRSTGRLGIALHGARVSAGARTTWSEPEYVFASVVVQKAFPSEKSGVLVTVDVDTGRRRAWLTVAVNEGVGGAVEGQAAESLQDSTRRPGEVLLPRPGHRPAQDGALCRHRAASTSVPASGHARHAAAAGRDRQADRPVSSASWATASRPCRTRPADTIVPADVEFAFKNGRAHAAPDPAVRGERRSALGSSGYLNQIDAGLQGAREGRGRDATEFRRPPDEDSAPMSESPRARAWLLTLALWLASEPGRVAYPLDGYPAHGHRAPRRLSAWPSPGDRLERGTLPDREASDAAESDQIALRLASQTRTSSCRLPSPELQSASSWSMLGKDGSNPLRHRGPRSTAFRATAALRRPQPEQGSQQPGSVGKIVTLLAWFQALADVYPNDVEDRDAASSSRHLRSWPTSSSTRDSPQGSDLGVGHGLRGSSGDRSRIGEHGQHLDLVRLARLGQLERRGLVC